MQIKYSILKSTLKYSTQFDKEQLKFLQDIENSLGEKLVQAELTDYECDLKLIFVQSGGTESIFEEHYQYLKKPCYLLTNGGNNSLAASLEILAYVHNKGDKGEILHGNPDYIANRIQQLAKVQMLKNKLANYHYALMSFPSEWLIASNVDADLWKEKLGMNLHFITTYELMKGVTSQANAENPDYEMIKAKKIYSNIKKYVTKFNLQAFTISCFNFILNVKSTACYALAKFNKEGIVATCEGDQSTMLSMILVKEIFEQPSFQANPARIDTENNEIVFAHCTVPLNMCKTKKFTTHFESGLGVAIKGELKETDVTIFRLAANLKDYTIMQGTIVENLNEENLCRTQIRVKCEEDVSDLLKNPCGNHHVIFYGHHKDELNKMLNSLLN